MWEIIWFLLGAVAGMIGLIVFTMKKMVDIVDSEQNKKDGPFDVCPEKSIKYNEKKRRGRGRPRKNIR